MNTKNPTAGVCSTLLTASFFALTAPLTAQIAWTGTGTYTQDFSSFNGTEASLPTGFFAEADESPLPFVPGGAGGTVDGTNSTTGFRTFRLSTSPVDSNKRWFGIFEGSALSDSRLFAEIENTSGSTITALRVRYRTSIWRDGNRENSIRLKYNNSTGGFSSVSDSDVWVAKVNAGGNVAYDGNAPAYSDQRDVVIILPTPLANHATGYLRWQYSTNSGSGSRDGLGITDIQIDAIAEGTPLSWDGGSGDWSDENWAGDAWVTGRKATFAGTGSTLNVDDDFVVNGIQFNSTGWTLADNGGVLVLAGSVNIPTSGHTATINADLEGVDLVKNGAGTLVLGGNADLTGDLKLFAGTVRIGSGFTVPDSASIVVASDATFDLGGNDLTVRGLTGTETGTVDIDGAILTLKQPAFDLSYQGALTGDGDLIKTGIGEQAFQETAKTYTGETVIDQGRLIVTPEGIMSHTAGVTLLGTGSAAADGLLVFKSPGTYIFGGELPVPPTLLLQGGGLAAFSTGEATLANAVQVAASPGGRLIAGEVDEGPAGVVLRLAGALSGSGTLRCEGNGEIILSGSSTGFTGSLLLRGGLTTLPTGTTLGNNSITVTVAGADSANPARLRGPGTIAGNLTYGAHSHIDASELSGVTQVTGNLDLGTAHIDVSAVADGRYDLFEVGGASHLESVSPPPSGVLIARVGNRICVVKGVSVDNDANGLPDIWEITYFGSLGVNPSADPDGDGLSNLAEYLLGTDPTTPATPVPSATLNLIVFSP